MSLTNMASGGSGGGDPPKKPKQSAARENLDDSSHNSDSNPSDNKGELIKKKLRSNQLLQR